MVHKVVALCLGLCYWLLGLGGTPLPLHDALIDCGGQFHAGASHPQSYKAVLRPHEARHMIAIRRLFNPARGSVWHDGLSCASGIISAWRLARLPYIVMLTILPCIVQLGTLYGSGNESIIKPPITSNPTLTHSDYTQIRATCTKYRDHWPAGSIDGPGSAAPAAAVPRVGTRVPRYLNLGTSIVS